MGALGRGSRPGKEEEVGWVWDVGVILQVRLEDRMTGCERLQGQKDEILRAWTKVVAKGLSSALGCLISKRRLF